MKQQEQVEACLKGLGWAWLGSILTFKARLRLDLLGLEPSLHSTSIALSLFLEEE